MRLHTRNRPTARVNDLSCPPVPASFAVEQPTQAELQQREHTADTLGVRPIESPWPSQPPRQLPMSGRGNHNSRRGRSGRDNNTGSGPMNYLRSAQDEALPSRPAGFGGRGQMPSGAAIGRGRGDIIATPRKAPVLRSLPTEAERRATIEERNKEAAAARRAKKEEKYNNKRMANINRNSSPNRNTSNGTTNRSNEPINLSGRATDLPRASSNNTQPNRDSSPPPASSPPPPPPSTPQAMQYSVLLRNDDWRSWPEVQVKVGTLPLGYTTLDVYNLFEKYGVLEGIELFENSHGTRDGYAKLKFSRVFAPFWNNTIPYIWHNAECHLNAVLFGFPKHKFKVESPANKCIQYPDRFTFKSKKLDFGFMIEPEVMMAMYTTKDNEDITFEVNLYRKQVDVIFRIYLTNEGEACVPGSPTAPTDQEPEPEPVKDRWESYRFQIPFSHLNQIMEQGPIISDNDRTFLISLPSPPLFWRELHHVANSHNLNASYWTSWDKWFRQTGIAYNQRDRSKSPISLKQRNPIIDTGRWTTYRFHFRLESSQVDRFGNMLSALRDFNVKTEILDGLEVTTEKRIPIWDSIEVRSTNSFSGDLSEALRPLLPYPTRYQLEVCISQNFLNEFNITTEFIDRLTDMGSAEAVRLLEFVAEQKKQRFYDPMAIFNLTGVKGGTAALLKRLGGDNQLVRKASITPSTVYYATPTVETTNRVIRHYRQYSDRFLRVQFMDEFKGRINSTNRTAMNEVFTRIMTTLEHGITIGGIHFEFLAFGNSQIREHGAYFFASDDHVSVDDIRTWMGTFEEIRVVAKHAARLGQCFSTTRAIRGVQVDVVNIDDITYPDNEYKFSDGVGKISEFLAKLISMELKLPQNEPPPSCFQFRLGGCKGVLTVWPDAIQREVYIRPTQEKFKAKHSTLEVIRCSHLATASLNRQLIIVLSSLGASDNVFILKLLDMLRKFEDAMVRPAAALSLLCRTIDANQFTLDLAAIVRDRFMEYKDPFVMSLLGLWRAWSIKYLKEKAKIMIEKGAFVLGVVDETGILKGHYDDDTDNDDQNDDQKGKGKGKANPPAIPEIFLQISDPEIPGQFRVIEELCIVARNPSLHPGDIRTVRAVNVPELHHLRNVVVFPNNGDRDLASMLSGGDLDGDDYIVIWDHDLTYGITDHKPMDYSPMVPNELSRNVEVDDITRFFVNYMRNDKLGAIANSHLAWADFHEDGVKSDQCFRLAALHSDAVDYVKTGVPAEMPRELRLRKYPHFMEKEPDKTYRSHKILGKLYDQVVKVDFVPCYEFEFDQRILGAYTLSPDLLTVAKELKDDYDSALRSIMAQHEIYTEFEVYSTFVMHHSEAAKDYKFHEEIGNIRSGLRDIWRKAAIQIVGDSDELKLGPFVAAMYTVTKKELDTALEDLKAKKSKGKKSERPIEGAPLKFTPGDIKDMPLISFPWLFPEILGRLANREHPFTDIDNPPDGILRQYEYDYVAVPETRRNTRSTEPNGTQHDSKSHKTTSPDDLTEYEIIPVEEVLGNGSAYSYFDYNKERQQSDNGISGVGVTKRENNHSHAFDSDGNSSEGIDCLCRDTEQEFRGENAGGINKKENYHASQIGSDNGEASSILDDDGANGLSFCEELFKDVHPED